MLSTEQKPGIKLAANVQAADVVDMQAMLDTARGLFDVDAWIRDMLLSAHSTNPSKVYLEEEGWHQLAKLYGKLWKHITLRDNYWTFHCYAEVTSALDHPKKRNAPHHEHYI